MKNEINIQIGLLNYRNVLIFFGVNLRFLEKGALVIQSSAER